MGLRIGCDLDGVLADMDSAIAEAVERLFGPLLPPPPPRTNGTATADVDAGNPKPATNVEEVASSPEEAAAIEDELPSGELRMLSARQQRQLWQHIRETENFWESLNEIEAGVVARLGVLAQERRWEVLFITQRPPSAGDTCQLQTQRWLARHGFPYPSVYVIRGARGRIATALDLEVLLDDRPENCLDVVVDSKARSILIWRGDPQGTVPANARRLGIDVMGSVQECLDKLVEADTRVERPGLLGRIRQLINPT